MRRDWITYGLIAFALGALLLWAMPDEATGDDARAARDDGAAGADWSDWLGGLLALAGLGLALAGFFKDEGVGYDHRTHKR